MSEVSDFVNSNAANVNIMSRWDELMEQPDADGDDVMFETLPDEFVQGLGNVERDEAAFPVYAYTLEGRYVAWYDCENFVGFRR